jgi:hypothetical protein
MLILGVVLLKRNQNNVQLAQFFRCRRPGGFGKDRFDFAAAARLGCFGCKHIRPDLQANNCENQQENGYSIIHDFILSNCNICMRLYLLLNV